MENSIYKILEWVDKPVLMVDKEDCIIWLNKTARNLLDGDLLQGRYFYGEFLKQRETMSGIKDIVMYAGNRYLLEKEALPTDDYSVYYLKNQMLTEYEVKEAYYETILEHISEGILGSDGEGKVILYNKAAEEIEGLKAQDILNRHLDEIYISNAQEGSEHEKVRDTGKPILNQYRNFALCDRMGHYISYNTYPVQKDGKIMGAVTISRNEKRLQELIFETIELKRKIACSHDRAQSKENSTAYTFENIIGNSKETSELIREAQMMAMVDSNILVIGETGTGKEVFAQSIHHFSKKSKQPFIAINCSAIPENLLESILFGTVKGAYTGAQDSTGLLEDAGEGTLFLDELNSMPLAMQSKLLRVLQEKKVRKVGGSKLFPVNCRIISAVNEDPKNLMDTGRLRKDLFYRVSSLVLYLPPLRERKRDIEALIQYFIERYNRILQKNVRGVSDELKEILLGYNWPGNIRELEYVIENLMIRSGINEQLMVEDIPPYLRSDLTKINYEQLMMERREKQGSLKEILEEIERELIVNTLEETNWNVTKAAEKLQILRQSLRCKMIRLNIVREQK
ncbi:arginine utilization regulatory protein [Natronincola ferrireducens]|uniref:Arginine utilization regulatory protein n=2 Tax=Natronincola ferrireducens TaxID=393762 RepID=A0A1G9IRC2_9FIRM|nr:arginine utilization regulatory protein [Natronincola ferrireducens]